MIKSAWNGKNKSLTLLCLVGIMLTFVPGCDDAPMRPGEGFYSYRGFRDWWRIPLKFPYQIMVIDSFEQGYLEKYDPASLIAAPECQTLAEDVTVAGYNEKFAVFKQKNQAEPWGILVYDSGKIVFFSSEQELEAFIRETFPDASAAPLMNLQDFYQHRWRTIDAIQKQDPQKLYYPEADIAPRRPGEGFYAYQGYSHWWRIPLKFPYQIKVTDSFRAGGRLEKYDPTTLITAPQFDLLAQGITAVAYERLFALFRRKDKNFPYGILVYASGKVRDFTTENEVEEFIRRNYPDTPMPELEELEAFYTMMWKAFDVVRQENPQVLDYGY